MKILSSEEAILGYALEKLIRLKCPKCNAYSDQLKDGRKKKTCPYCKYTGRHIEWEKHIFSK